MKEVKGWFSMSDDKRRVKNAELEARRKRVNRLKKIIVAIVIICLLLPSILCLTLWAKVSHLEKQLKSFTENYNFRQQSMQQDTALAANVKDKKETKEDAEDEDKASVEDQTKITGKKVYLTFDDGPSKNTEKILEILDQYDVKATFFVIGQTDEHSKQMYQKIYNEGHTLAMHSYTHQYQKIYKSVSAYKKDLSKLSDLLYDTVGIRPKYVRFPGGSSNTVSNVDMKEIIRYMNKAGYIYYDWNVINGDATGKNYTKKEMVDSVMSGVNQYDNSIVLMHDSAGKEKPVEILPTILKKLKKMKANVLAINDTTVPVQHIKADEVK